MQKILKLCLTITLFLFTNIATADMLFNPSSCTFKISSLSNKPELSKRNSLACENISNESPYNRVTGFGMKPMILTGTVNSGDLQVAYEKNSKKFPVNNKIIDYRYEEQGIQVEVQGSLTFINHTYRLIFNITEIVTDQQLKYEFHSTYYGA